MNEEGESTNQSSFFLFDLKNYLSIYKYSDMYSITSFADNSNVEESFGKHRFICKGAIVNMGEV